MSVSCFVCFSCIMCLLSYFIVYVCVIRVFHLFHLFPSLHVFIHLFIHVFQLLSMLLNVSCAFNASGCWCLWLQRRGVWNTSSWNTRSESSCAAYSK